MEQRPRLDPPTGPGTPIGPPGSIGTRIVADRRLERSSRVVLQIGAALAAVFVLLPGVGLAAVMVLLASLETWHGGEGRLAVEDRLMFLSAALLASAFVVACALVLRRGLRRGPIALAVVGLGGLALVAIGVRGIVEATGIDSLITALSWGVAVTGVVLTLGAALGIASRVQAAHPRPG
jgi:hypothetical protein